MSASATILNVDDNEIGRYTKSRLLREAGFNVLEAVTGADALRLVREAAPDLVLLDVRLPDISGIEVCRLLKEDSQLQYIPVLHASASCVDPSTQAHGLETGADAYLVEPVEPIVLVATINALLRARRAEDKLRASQMALDDLFRNAPVGLRLVDADGTVLRVNDAELKMLSLTSDEQYIGRHVSAFHADRQIVERILASIREGGAAGKSVHDLECELVASDGSRRHVLISASGFFQGTMLVHSRWFVRDITDQRIADEQIRRQSEALARSNADLEDFAYIASHDLKEPLRGIHNYSDFLLEDYRDQLNEDGRHMLETLKRLSKRMDLLISSLLEYSRVGRTEMAMGDVDLNIVAADAVESLHGLMEEHSRGGAAEVRIPAPLPTVRCDRIRTVEIFRNLIANGIKYNVSDHKVVEIGIVPADQMPPHLHAGEGTVTLFFRDNGIGIAEKHRAGIFRMFKRLHGRDEYGGGTGSGLAIVKRLVERHGGKITLESTPGEGSTFFVTL